MKKHIITLLSALGFVFAANAVGWSSGTSFEELSIDATPKPDGTPGNVFDPSADDSGGSSGEKFWTWANAGATTIGDSYITNSVAWGSYSGAHPDDAPSPNEKCLVLDTEGERFYRNINSGDAEPAYSPVEIGDGIYFDSVVQFTASSDTPSVESGDKLVVWLHGVDADEMASDPRARAGYTNLVVTAGYLSAANEASQSNYVVTVDTPTPINSDEWHRLTIKAISSIGNPAAEFDYTVPGFVVYIDGIAVHCADSKGHDSSAYGNIDPSTPAYWKSRNALFPSMVTYGPGETPTLQMVGFAGTGKIDDIYFTSNAPDITGEGSTITLVWGEGVTQVQYKIDSAASWTTATTGAAISMSDSGAHTITLNVTYDSANGWYADGMTDSTGADVTEFPYAFSGVESININAIQMPFSVGGTVYDNIADAIDAASLGDKKVTLVANVSSFADENVVEIPEDVELTLDLNGKSITANLPSIAAIYVNEGAKLTIIDSVGTGVVNNTAEPGDGDYELALAVWNTGALVIGDGAENTTDKGATFGAVLNDTDVSEATLSIVRGNFYRYGATTIEQLFDNNNYLADGSLPSINGDYFVVEPRDPVVVDVTVTAEHATVTGVGATASEGDDLTITVTADEGYHLTEVTINDVAQGTDGTYTYKVGTDDIEIVVETEADTPVVQQVNVSSSTDGHAAVTFTTGVTDGKADVNSTITFTVATDENYHVTSVTIGGDEIADVSGTYSYEITGTDDITVVVTTAQDEPPVAETVNVTTNTSHATVTFTEGVTDGKANKNSTIKFTVAVDTGWTLSSVTVGGAAVPVDDGTYSYAVGTVDVEIVVATSSSGGTSYNGGDGSHSFTISAEAAAAITLPAGKTLTDTVEGTGMTYAQAYALGLLDDSGNVADLPSPTIAIEGGQVKVGYDLANAKDYTITFKVYKTASLSPAAWAYASESEFDIGDSAEPYSEAATTAGFYKVELFIADKN